jgi:hypothetical protein
MVLPTPKKMEWRVGLGFRALCCSCTVFSWFQRSIALTVLDYNEVNVMLKFAEIFGAVLSGEGGSTIDWWC